MKKHTESQQKVQQPRAFRGETMLSSSFDTRARVEVENRETTRLISRSGVASATRVPGDNALRVSAKETADSPARLRLRERMRAAIREEEAEPRTTNNVRPAVDDRAMNEAGWEEQFVEEHTGPDAPVAWHHPRLGWIWSRQGGPAAGVRTEQMRGTGSFGWYALPNGMLEIAKRGPFQTIEAAIRSLETRGGAA